MSNAQGVFPIPGPLAGLEEGYASELAGVGYAPASVRMQLKLFADLSEWLLKQGAAAIDLTSSDLNRFLDDRRLAGHSRYSSSKAVRPILDYLERLEAIEKQIENKALGQVEESAGDVSAFVTAHCPRLSRGAAKLTVTALRSFLGFLHLEGVIAESLSSAVPPVAGRRLVGLPKGLAPDQVQCLLASCDRHASKAHHAMVSAAIHSVFAQEDQAAASRTWPHVAGQLRARFLKLAVLMDTAEADVLAFMVFPCAH